VNQTDTSILEVVQEHIAAYNEGDSERFKETLTRDAVLAFRAVDRVCRGADDITEAFWALRENFRDLHVQVTSAFSTGTRATVEVIRSANSTMSGVRVTVQECMVYSLRQGKIATISYYTDRMTELVQLGAVSSLHAPALPAEPVLAHPHEATARPRSVPHALRAAFARRSRPTYHG
jgi:ketosteroid isomerase-like protein